jgi:hypothetical protein
MFAGREATAFSSYMGLTEMRSRTKNKVINDAYMNYRAGSLRKLRPAD